MSNQVGSATDAAVNQKATGRQMQTENTGQARQTTPAEAFGEGLYAVVAPAVRSCDEEMMVVMQCQQQLSAKLDKIHGTIMKFSGHPFFNDASLQEQLEGSSNKQHGAQSGKSVLQVQTDKINSARNRVNAINKKIASIQARLNKVEANVRRKTGL